LIYTLNDNDYLVINILGAVNDELFLNLSTTDIKPIGKEFPDVFFKEVDVLFQLKGLPELDDNPVKRVKIIAIVTTVAGEVHNGQTFLFSVGIHRLILLPIY
jgi:hypothetical protein